MITVVTGYTKDDITNFVDNCFGEHIRTLDFPEEGIHPRYACQTLDDAVKNDNDLVIMTLGECIVNRVSYLIAKKIITEADIYWLDNLGKAHHSEYKENGMILGWQIGFFSPEKLL